MIGLLRGDSSPSSRSVGFVAALALVLLTTSMLLLLVFQLAQIVIQPIKALRPEPSVVFRPLGDVLKRVRLEATRPPLRLAAARNEAGAFEHLEMLGDGGHAHLEWLGQLGDRGLAGSETSQDRAPSGIGEGCEGAAEAIRRHTVLNLQVK